MAGWRDPPHERVRLTPAEMRAVEQLEQVFQTGPRRRRWTRLVPWLVPVGAIVMLLALPSSLPVSALGAVLTGIGMAALLRRPWLSHGRLPGRFGPRRHL